MSSTELTKRIRQDIADCRRLGSEGRFEDAVVAADNALATLASSPREANELVGLHAAARGYRGMALLQLKQFQLAVLALEESYVLFQERTKKHHEAATPLFDKVTNCLVQACRILGRGPPLPPLVKFPRTPHLFRPTNSKAVTDDDLVLSRDDSLFNLLATAQLANGGNPTRISFEEKIDGANLGISLSLDGTVLVQNRSHYISHGEHAQFSPLASWVEVHEKEIKRLLEPPETTALGKRRILYGEWVVARHSIKYERLPGYFLAFDISEGGRFVSRRRFHDMMRGSGIPVAPALVDVPDMAGLDRTEMERAFMDMLRTPSRFRSDGGPIEGIVIRVDRGDWMEHRCKLVDPEFTAGITGHWAKSKIEKQRIDADFASVYFEGCYRHSPEDGNSLADEVSNPRQRAAVSYSRELDGQMVATCTILPKEPSSRQEGVVVLPRNLCWLWTNEVLVSSTPKSVEQIEAVRDALNVGLVITLTKEEPLPTGWFSRDCENYFCPVSDGMPPTLQQMDDIGDAVVRTACSGRSVFEHCGGGKGRAGTVAACLLLRFGLDGTLARIEAENNDGTCNNRSGRSLRPREPFMSGEEAIAEVRRRRHGSLETPVQENFVREYAQHLWRTAASYDRDRAVSPSEDGRQSTETNFPKERRTMAKRRVPKYIVLAGLPGSGKSTLAKRLSLNDGNNANNEWVHASTDDMGKRVCCDVVGRVAAKVSQGRAGGIVVDACNINPSKRREWLEVMHRPCRDSTALVFLDVPAEVCIERVRCRVDHPTIPFGRGGRVVESFVKSMELPTTKENEIFGQIVVVRSEDDISSLLMTWGVDV